MKSLPQIVAANAPRAVRPEPDRTREPATLRALAAEHDIERRRAEAIVADLTANPTKYGPITESFRTSWERAAYSEKLRAARLRNRATREEQKRGLRG